MLSLEVLFWLLMLFFAAVGAIRGWVREIFVTTALMLAFVIIAFLLRGSEPVWQGAWPPALPPALLVPGQAPQPPLPQGPAPNPASPAARSAFIYRVVLLGVLAFFGYQTAGLGRFASRTAPMRKQDLVLGAFLGLVNGYLLVGSLWYYLAAYGYPVSGFEPPREAVPFLLPYMFPRFILKPVLGGTIPLALVGLLVLMIFLVVVLL